MIVTEAIYEVRESHNCAWTFETHFTCRFANVAKLPYRGSNNSGTIMCEFRAEFPKLLYRPTAILLMRWPWRIFPHSHLRVGFMKDAELFRFFPYWTLPKFPMWPMRWLTGMVEVKSGTPRGSRLSVRKRRIQQNAFHVMLKLHLQ